VWQFTSTVPGVGSYARRIDWKLKLQDGSLLTDVRHSKLLSTCKMLLWSMRVVPSRRKRPSDSSLIRTATYLLLLVEWLATESISSVDDVTPAVARRYTAYCRSLSGRDHDSLANDSLRKRLEPLLLLFEFRAKLPERMPAHPFGGNPLSAICGKSTTRKPIPPVPQEVLLPLLDGAVSWMRAGKEIIARYDKYLQIYAGALTAGYSRASARYEALDAVNTMRQKDNVPKGCPQPRGAREIFFAYEMLVAACAIICLACSGIRMSELLSIREGAIRYIRHSNDREYSYLCARVKKTVEDDEGVELFWIVPPLVVQAVEILEIASVRARSNSRRNELFLTPHDRHAKKYNLVEQSSLIDRINALSMLIEVPRYFGKIWRFSGHQFRKFFARYVTLSERGGNLALTTHFKHLRMAMTDRSYVGNDYDLHELINEEQIGSMADMWQHVLEEPEHCVGQGGARLQKLVFQGRAGSDLAKNHVIDLIVKLDKPIFALPHCYCGFEESTSACGGRRETHAGIFTCLESCPNAIVTRDHQPYYEEMRDKNLALLKANPGRVARAAINRALGLANQILEKLSKYK